jgi:hypothetical protein
MAYCQDQRPTVREHAAIVCLASVSFFDSPQELLQFRNVAFLVLCN